VECIICIAAKRLEIGVKDHKVCLLACDKLDKPDIEGLKSLSRIEEAKTNKSVFWIAGIESGSIAVY